MQHNAMISTYISGCCGNENANFPHLPNPKGASVMSQFLPYVVAPWGPEQHLDIVKFCIDVAEKVDPAFMLIDPLCPPAHDMARMERWKDKHAILSEFPNQRYQTFPLIAMARSL